MAALLTYRSRDSFEARFGRNMPDPSRQQTINGVQHARPSTPGSEHFAIHNEGHRRAGAPRTTSINGDSPSSSHPQSPLPHSSAPQPAAPVFTDPQFHGATPLPPTSTISSATTTTGTTTVPPPTTRNPSTHFSAQSYLRYQGEKFIRRFDANCYIAITRKLDTHDVSRARADTLADALALIRQPTLVLGIETDGLFTFAEQREIASGVPGARLEKIVSPEGHDAFLLQFEQVNAYILAFLRESLPDLMGGVGRAVEELDEASRRVAGDGSVVKESTFGEAEVEDITAW